MGRQNGKTEIGAVLGLYGLLRPGRQLVIGIASSKDQSTIVYKRALAAITSNPSLAKRFKRLTDTRGIQSLDGDEYLLKASKSAALQGLPISLGVVDEVHLIKRELWTDLLNGTGGRSNALLVGITTAGDDTSELLKGLYKTGLEAAEADPGGPLERFGFFLWEAPEAAVPETDAELLALLQAANPSLAEGRTDAENVLADVRSMVDPAEVIRYRLNRFVESTSLFIPMSKWETCRQPFGEAFPTTGGPLVFGFDRSPDWSYATVTVARKVGDLTYTRVIASIKRPEPQQLVDIAVELWKHNPNTFVVDGLGLKELAAELKRRGLPVTVLTLGDVFQASELFFAKVQRGIIRHPGDDLLTMQLPRTIRKNVGDRWRVSRKDSSTEIDSVMATVGAVFAAEKPEISPDQLYF